MGRSREARERLPVYGELLSTWPAASGVLVEDGTAYVAAGLVNYDGTYVYALDPATGAVRWSNDTSGHLDAEAHTGVSVQGHLLFSDGKLYMAGGNAVSPAVYDVADGKCLNDPASLVKCEPTSARGWELFLVGDRVIACGRPLYTRPELPVYDHTVTKKLFHATAGKYDVVWLDTAKLLSYEPLDKDALSRCVTDELIPRHVTQTWGQFKVDEKPRWQRDCPGSIAIAVSNRAVVIADTSQVAAVELESGKELWSQPLPAAPVPWGMAVDRAGHVILTLVVSAHQNYPRFRGVGAGGRRGAASGIPRRRGGRCGVGRGGAACGRPGRGALGCGRCGSTRRGMLAKCPDGGSGSRSSRPAVGPVRL